MTRYFMTIPEAAQLVLQASAIADGGEVFVLEMGEPIKIEELAETMVRLYGKRLRRDTGNLSDIEIVVDGLRPGEKLFEEMFITDDHGKTQLNKIYCAFETMICLKDLRKGLIKLSLLCERGQLQDIRDILLVMSMGDSDSAVPQMDRKNIDHSLRV